MLQIVWLVVTTTDAVWSDSVADAVLILSKEQGVAGSNACQHHLVFTCLDRLFSRQGKIGIHLCGAGVVDWFSLYVRSDLGGNSIECGCPGFCFQRGCLFGGCISELVARNVGMSWDPSLDGDVPNALIQAGFELVDFDAGS